MAMKTVPVAPGMFCWFELTTRDVKLGSAFYRSIMGAATRGVPSGGDHDYLLFEVEGHTVAGLMPMGSEFPSSATSHWLPYLSVDDVDAACIRASELGGKVCCGPTDTPIGRSALVSDPTGGVFSLFQARPGAPDGTNPIGPGAFVWCELVTRDLARASEFYAHLFGWTPQFCRVGATSYIEMKAGEHPVASVFEACADEASSLAHWCPYLCVDDIHAALAAAVRHGGTQLCEPMDIPGDGPCAGRYAGITDPTGAHIALFEPANLSR